MGVDKFLCIHGHFYQPPRENPWLEAIELQDSAYPYHDWNERIAAECYAPNAHARILDAEGLIAAIQNNYTRISFNFGPTLLSWMQVAGPELYASLQRADRESQQRFHGHGSAIAQGYNHMILPLANARDLTTQIAWGIADFQYRFGRRPEGLWLPETAANLACLEAIAAAGIAFTILAPSQARRVRQPGSETWEDVGKGQIDPRRAYWAALPSGRKLALFFYDGPIARAVAFEGLLGNGDKFAHRLLDRFSSDRSGPQLVHIATDGESYGHHHRFGDMALAYALDRIEREQAAEITNYGAFLAAHPPELTVEIWENSSWSCVHGVERWRADCGCNTGGHAGWNQRWRAPLRESLDWLRDQLAAHFEREAAGLLRDPWAARNAYIEAVLDRGRTQAFLDQQQSHPLSPEEATRALELLELQRHAMLMFTSCGWFFDELSGIETVQVLQYAGRALQLAQHTGAAPELESEFLHRLEPAVSNIAGYGNGRQVFDRFVRPAQVHLAQVGAHYAVSSLFEEYGEEASIFGFHVRREDSYQAQSGRMRFGRGRIRVRSRLTRASATFSYAVLHLGDHNLSGGVRPYQNEQAYSTMNRQLEEAFARADVAELLRGIDRDFGSGIPAEGGTYSLRLLFRDERHKVLNRVLETSRRQAEDAYQEIYNLNAPLLRFLHSLLLPVPHHLAIATEEVLRRDMFTVMETVPLDRERLRLLAQEAHATGIDLTQGQDLSLAMGRVLDRLARDLQSEPRDLSRLIELDECTRLAEDLPFSTQLGPAQDIVFGLLHVYRDRRGDSSGAGVNWRERFEQLCRGLRIRIPPADQPTGGGAKPSPTPASVGALGA